MGSAAVDRVILFGGSFLFAELCRWLATTQLETLVFTSPRHLADPVGADGRPLRALLSDLGIRTFEVDDINESRDLRAHVTPDTIGVALGAAWIFEPRTVELFGGRLVDVMGIDLPRLRGGAHYSWQILMGDRTGACHIQKILGGAATLHRGPVLFSRTYAFPLAARIPRDYFDAAVPIELETVKAFLAAVGRGDRLEPRTLDESRATYWSALATVAQGYVDWSWTSAEIERFICAFDEPYAGASSFVNGRRVFLKDCRADATSGALHPFQAGLVYRIDGATFVGAAGGGLRIGSLRDEAGAPCAVSLGDRIDTPANVLAEARAFQAVYGARGLVS